MEMVSRMEELQRGERVLPPCDRCRRLHMDCLKNLTACMGCTKKHAKCSWKDVKEEELRQYPPPSRARERAAQDREREQERETGVSNGTGAEPAPGTRPASEPQQAPKEPQPRRAASEIQGSAVSSHERRISINRNNENINDDDDPDANQRLMQAIMDTVDNHARAAAAAAGKDRENDLSSERERDRRMAKA